MHRALLLLALIGCARETPPNKQEPAKPKPAIAVEPTKTCLDRTKASAEVTAVEQRRHSAFAKALGDQGLEHVTLPLQELTGKLAQQLTTVGQPPTGKKGGGLITGCHMMTGCCSQTVDTHSVHCGDGSGDPGLYKNAKGELFLVRDSPRINTRVVEACGEAPPTPCTGGCGCPTQFIGTYVEVPPDLTYRGVLDVAYEVSDVVVTYERPSAVPPCRPVP